MKMIKLSDGRKVSIEEAKQILFKAYTKFHEMDGLPVKSKARGFSEIAGMIPGWRVIGITKAALEKFQKLDYKRPPGRGPDGVNRAHKYSRLETGVIAFENPIRDYDKFWDFWLKRDITVLATVNENYSKESEVIAYEVPEDLGLFEAYGYSYRVEDKEVEFLRSLR